MKKTKKKNSRIYSTVKTKAKREGKKEGGMGKGDDLKEKKEGLKREDTRKKPI
jgi:hypothetical protein